MAYISSKFSFVINIVSVIQRSSGRGVKRIGLSVVPHFFKKNRPVAIMAIVIVDDKESNFLNFIVALYIKLL